MGGFREYFERVKRRRLARRIVSECLALALFTLVASQVILFPAAFLRGDRFPARSVLAVWVALYCGFRLVRVRRDFDAIDADCRKTWFDTDPENAGILLVALESLRRRPEETSSLERLALRRADAWAAEQMPETRMRKTTRKTMRKTTPLWLLALVLAFIPFLLPGRPAMWHNTFFPGPPASTPRETGQSQSGLTETPERHDAGPESGVVGAETRRFIAEERAILALTLQTLRGTPGLASFELTESERRLCQRLAARQSDWFTRVVAQHPDTDTSALLRQYARHTTALIRNNLLGRAVETQQEIVRWLETGQKPLSIEPYAAPSVPGFGTRDTAETALSSPTEPKSESYDESQSTAQGERAKSSLPSRGDRMQNGSDAGQPREDAQAAAPATRGVPAPVADSPQNWGERPRLTPSNTRELPPMQPLPGYEEAIRAFKNGPAK